jgi:mannose-1-phosphate guanylyltransferase/mannose-6-phosphate isomerase
MTDRIHPVLLSGGAGTRLMPLSRPEKPKQFLSLAGDKTLIQQTALRVRLHDLPIIVGNRDHRALITEQMQGIGVVPRVVVLEPVGRSTAASAALAALLSPEPQNLILLLPSDHAVTNEPAFLQAIDAAADAARQGYITTFGMTPDRPETGYGYIQKGEEISHGALRVKRFAEKPPLDAAKEYLASGDYLWNSGMFLFRADVMLEELKRHAPEVLPAVRAALENAKREDFYVSPEAEAFLRVPMISLDHAVMEKTDRAAVVPCDIGWSDIGSWASLIRFAKTRGDLAKPLFRPWGSSFSAAIGDGFQVKELIVNPRSRLSLQRHKHREEHWLVAQGVARVTRNEEAFDLAPGNWTHIPLGAKHRLENPGDEPLVIVEVQFGDYLGEDDIERFSDDYGRV